MVHRLLMEYWGRSDEPTDFAEFAQEWLSSNKLPADALDLAFHTLVDLRGEGRTVGVISPVSHLFCSSCNRIRVGADGLARCDFFLEERGPARGFLCNEVNTMPGFTPISMFPKMLIASGMTYPEIIDRLVELTNQLSNFRVIVLGFAIPLVILAYFWRVFPSLLLMLTLLRLGLNVASTRLILDSLRCLAFYLPGSYNHPGQTE